jgi:hypothetical protein
VKNAVTAAPGLGLLVLTAGLIFSAPASAASSLINVPLSEHSAGFTSGVPMIAINPRNERNVLVVWRTFSLPFIEHYALGSSDTCTVSVSMDGGDSFKPVVLPLTSGDTTACNAPFVTVDSKGLFYAGGSIFALGPRASDGLWQGHVGLARSSDGGMTWTAAGAPIGTETAARFDPGIVALVPNTPTPWDGGRGFFDPDTGDLFVSGSKAIAPSAADHAQRYFTVSHDRGRTFGAIHSFDSKEWPERWDGSFVPAHGVLGVAYVAAATPDVHAQCPCVVFETSTDGGTTFQRQQIAQSAAFTTRELVHYPQTAANPRHKGEFALTLVAADRRLVEIRITADFGKTWRTVVPEQPAGVQIVSRPGLRYSPDGVLVVTWRGMTSLTSYDVYAAAVDKSGVHATLKISTATSTYPAIIAGKHLDGGDFVTWVAVDHRMAHFAWPDARTGDVSRPYYGRVALVELLSSPAVAGKP